MVKDASEGAIRLLLPVRVRHARGRERAFKHKIVDWEAGALFWNCRRSHGMDWEVPFRAKLEEQLGGRDLMFLMGNQHRFQTSG
jgi:hypothetical protein